MARDIEMKVTILTGSEELNLALERYLWFTFSEEVTGVFKAMLGNPATIHHEMLSSHLWIAEVFNPENIENPEGFRTAKKFAGKVRFLLLFVSLIPRNFPEEGPFWMTFLSNKPLSEKIREVLDKPSPAEEDFEKAEEMWSRLKYKPEGHHH